MKFLNDSLCRMGCVIILYGERADQGRRLNKTVNLICPRPVVPFGQPQQRR